MCAITRAGWSNHTLKAYLKIGVLLLPVPLLLTSEDGSQELILCLRVLEQPEFIDHSLHRLEQRVLL